MSKLKTISAVSIAVLLISIRAHGVMVTLDFTGQGSTFDYEERTGSFFTDGVTLNLQALVVGSTGILNGASGDYGVNEANTGDVTDRLDIVNGAESILINFNAGNPKTFVTLDNIVIDNFSGTDVGTYRVNGGAGVSLADGILDVDIDVTGGSILVAVSAGNGFSFDGIQLTINTIPEPSSFALMGLSAIIVHQFRRRRSRQQAQALQLHGRDGGERSGSRRRGHRWVRVI